MPPDASDLDPTQTPDGSLESKEEPQAAPSGTSAEPTPQGPGANGEGAPEPVAAAGEAEPSEDEAETSVQQVPDPAPIASGSDRIEVEHSDERAGEPDDQPDESANVPADDPGDEIDVDDLEEIDAAELEPVGRAPTAPPPTPAAAARPSPLEQRLESPSVIDRALENVASGNWEGRARELLRDLDAATDKARVGAIAYEIGELFQRRLADDARAVKAYGRALQADPSLRPNLWAIRRVFYQRGLWPNLIKLIDAEVRFARSDRERADLLVEKAHVLEDRLGQRGEATEAFRKAAALDLTSIQALMGVERLAIQDKDEDALDFAWRGLAEASDTPERRLSYLLALVPLHAERGEQETVRELLDQASALGLEGSSAEAILRARLRIAEQTGDPNALLEALEERYAQLLARCGPSGPPEPAAHEAGEPPDRSSTLRLQMVAVRRRQARIAKESGDTEHAWDYLQAALGLAPGEPLLLADLADIAEELGKFAELAELCQGWESVEADPARSLSLSLRRADAMLRSGNREQANALLESLSASAPGYLPIISMRERDALAASDWRKLAAVYEAAGAAAQLGTTFGPGTDPAVDKDAAAAAYVAAGDLHAAYLNEPDEARAHYSRALEVIPGYPPAVEALVGLHEGLGHLDEAVELLELHSELDDETRRRDVLERLARLYQELGQSEQQLSALQRLLELDPDDVGLRWRVEAALAATGKAAERAAMLIELAERASDPMRKATILLDAARIFDDELDDAERAAALYRRVLESWPGNRYASAALVALLRRAERWEELVEARRAEAAQLEDGPALARTLREAAYVLRYQFDKPAQAAELYRELLDRVPGEPFAMRGLADALREADDLETLIEVLEQRVESIPEPHREATLARSLVELGAAQERAGRLEDAADSYRRAATAGGGAHAAVGLLALAAGSDDASPLVEAIEQLAPPNSELGGQLAEELGWLWAHDLGDWDRAAEALLAVPAERRTRGAAFALALVQAKRGEPAELGDALAELGRSLAEPYPAAALLLRAAAIAEVAGDPELAMQRVEGAVATASDDAATLVAAAEYLPAGLADHVHIDGDDTEAIEDARHAAIDRLLHRAELCEMRAAIAGNPASRDDWELDQAEALEAAGRLKAAAQIVTSVLETRPDDVRALQSLRRICRRGGDRSGLGAASLALARIIGDSQGKLALLREAASIYDGELAQLGVASLAYRRILTEDPGAPELERLCAIYREHQEAGGLIEVLGDRINYLDSVERQAEGVPLLHERALLRRDLGDRRGAVRDLTALLEIDPEQAGALSALGALVLEVGDHGRAADLYRRYVQVEHDAQKRADAELVLSQILAENMDDVSGAIDQLEHVLAQSPEDIEVRERLVRLLIRSGELERAAREIRVVEWRRSSNSERARDELRVAGIFRDHLGDAARAKEALERARQLDPLDVDAVRELAELVGAGRDPGAREKVLAHAAGDMRQAIAAEPSRAQLYERLAVIAGWRGDQDARYLALAALGGLRALDGQQRDFVASEAGKLAATTRAPTGALSEEDWRDRIAMPGAAGYAANLWAVIAEAVAKSTGFDPAQAGFGRGQRVKSPGKSTPQVHAAATALGLSSYELFVSGERKGYARAVSGARPVLYLGSDVAAAESAPARFLLARAIAHARQSTGGVSELRLKELLIFFAAAASVAGAKVPPQLAEVLAVEAKSVEEHARLLSKHLGRRDKRHLAQVAQQLGELPDLAEWHRAAMVTASRAGLLYAGDLMVALDILDVGRGGRSLADDPTGLALLSWAVGEEHLALRRHLGCFGGGR